MRMRMRWATRIGCAVVIRTNTRLNLRGGGESGSWVVVGLELAVGRLWVVVVQMWRLC